MFSPSDICCCFYFPYFIYLIENFIDNTETKGLANRMINFIINLQTLEIPGKRVSLRNYLSQHGIYSYLWKTIKYIN